MKSWIPIEPTVGNIHGFYRVRYPDGLRVEVVRCYSGEWAIFTYRHGTMTDECRNDSCAGLSYSTAIHRAALILCEQTRGIVGLSNTGNIPLNNKQQET
jgi:hypothetical protein